MSHGFVAMPVLVPQLIHSVRHCVGGVAPARPDKREGTPFSMARSWFSDRFRRTTQVVAAVAVVGVLAGCGTNASAAPGSGGTPTAAPVVDAHPVEPGSYPAYVKHEWGVTKIETEPKRIVALGFRDQEDFLAMGIKP